MTHSSRYRKKSASTAPTSGTERAIGSARKRSNIPLPMSAFMFCPIEMLLIAIVCPIRPGSRNWR